MLMGQHTRSLKYETEAFISHAADAVCEHQSSAVVTPLWHAESTPVSQGRKRVYNVKRNNLQIDTRQ